MKILFFDTETSGLPDKRKPLDHPDQPHLVQLAMLLKDGDREVSRVSVVVRCPVEPHEKAKAAHGYDMAMTERWGIQPIGAIGLFMDLVLRADLIVAHNIEFDLQIMRIAMAKLRREFPILESLPKLCTMALCEPHCRIPATPAQIAAGFKRKGEFKSPKLEEALKILCGEDLVGAHDALADVLACSRLYDWLQVNGHLEAAA